MKPLPLRLALFATTLLTLSLSAVPAGAQPEPPPTYLIQVSLLAASRTGSDDLADLPANTVQAIDDVRQFLPFKSYRLLDTALVRTDRHAQTSLVGPDDRQFEVSFSFNDQYVVATRGEKDGRLVVRNFEVIEKATPSPQRVAIGGGAAPVASITRSVLASSFAAQLNQTVVVGTSRLDGGDEALMVLFTALP